MNSKTVETGYTPRPIQAILHNSFKRFNVIVCHRRFGKTVGVINETIDQGLRNPKNRPQYAYIAPNYGQAKRVAWEFFKEFTSAIPGAKPHEGDLKIDIPRPASNDFVRFMLLGAENPGSLRGIYLDGVILDEYAEMNPEIWNAVIRPALSDRLGWGIFIGTPKGQNHFKDIYDTAKLAMKKGNPDWFAALYKASETGIMSHDELNAAKMTMSNEEYEQEFECSFTAALVGSYFGKYMEEAENEGRIGSVPYDRHVPVDTFWDLGIDDTTAIWFVQQIGQEIHLIDYVEDSGKGLEHYAKTILQKPYIYREHCLPHDGAARELGTGKSRQETLRAMGLKGTRVLSRWDVSDTIHAVRMIMNRCWFDEDKCERGIICLKNYERKWDGKEGVFKNTPRHNWASHGADAFRMLGQGLREEKDRPDIKRLPRMAELY